MARAGSSRLFVKVEYQSRRGLVFSERVGVLQQRKGAEAWSSTDALPGLGKASCSGASPMLFAAPVSLAAYLEQFRESSSITSASLSIDAARTDQIRTGRSHLSLRGLYPESNYRISARLPR